MRNKKLIPLEVIEKAVSGEPEAIELVLQYYSPRIKYLSKYRVIQHWKSKLRISFGSCKLLHELP